MPSSSPAIAHDLPCPETCFLLVVKSGGSGSMGWGVSIQKKQNKVIDFNSSIESSRRYRR